MLAVDPESNHVKYSCYIVQQFKHILVFELYMLILQDTWLPPPVILCDHVDSIEKVLPEFFQIIRLRKTTRDPSYDDFLHVSVRVSVGSHRR